MPTGMDILRTRPLGRSRVVLPGLGFGGSVIGNLHRPVAEADAIAAVDAAWRAGIRYFDTAPLYGAGLGERRLAQALRPRPRDAFVLSTKVGRLLRPLPPNAPPDPDRLPFEIVHDYGYEGVMRSVEDSLQRLGVTQIDVLLIHDIDRYNHGPEGEEQRFREAMAGGYQALVRLREQGVTKAIGVGVNNWQILVRCSDSGDFDCFLLAGRYSLLEQGALANFLPLCQARGIGVIVGAPFNSGILAHGARPGATYNYLEPPPEVSARVAAMERVAARHGVSLAAAALQFPLGHPAVTAVLPGPRSATQVDRAVAAFREDIPSAFWLELKEEQLIDRAAPTPPGADKL